MALQRPETLVFLIALILRLFSGKDFEGILKEKEQ
jgi:hypothetical protein